MTFRWSNAADAAFSKLKICFVSAPILVAPDPSHQFVVEVDASEVGVGAFHSQRSSADDKMHPCTFFCASGDALRGSGIVTVHGSVGSFCLRVVCADCLSALPSNPGADELIRVAAPDIHLGAYICCSVWGSCCQFVVTHALSCSRLSQALSAVPVSLADLRGPYRRDWSSGSQVSWTSAPSRLSHLRLSTLSRISYRSTLVLMITASLVSFNKPLYFHS